MTRRSLTREEQAAEVIGALRTQWRTVKKILPGPNDLIAAVLDCGHVLTETEPYTLFTRGVGRQIWCDLCR